MLSTRANPFKLYGGARLPPVLPCIWSEVLPRFSPAASSSCFAVKQLFVFSSDNTVSDVVRVPILARSLSSSHPLALRTVSYDASHTFFSSGKHRSLSEDTVVPEIDRSSSFSGLCVLCTKISQLTMTIVIFISCIHLFSAKWNPNDIPNRQRIICSAPFPVSVLWGGGTGNDERQRRLSSRAYSSLQENVVSSAYEMTYLEEAITTRMSCQHSISCCLIIQFQVS